jgi:hypothetical protein
MFDVYTNVMVISDIRKNTLLYNTGKEKTIDKKLMFTSWVDQEHHIVLNTIPYKLSSVFHVLQNMLDIELFLMDAMNQVPLFEKNIT